MRQLVLVVAVALSAALVSPARAQTDPPYSHTYEHVLVPMRDGVELSVRIWRPVVPPGTEVPVIATLSPYNALSVRANEQPLPTIMNRLAHRFVPRGYAYVLADVRGTHDSGGCWDYGGLNERRDGYDLVTWLGTREWSNGRVGMIGGSYDGTTANAAAVERPPHLATIVPISAISRWWGYAYHGGARVVYSGATADLDPPSDTPLDFMFAYGFLPPPTIGSLDDAQRIAMRWTPCDRVEQTLRGYDTEPDYDAFWVERDYLRHAPEIEVPTLVAHGLADVNVKPWEGTAWFQALAGPKRMVLGGWAHALPPAHIWNPLLDRWFDRWLLGVPNGVEDEPAVYVSRGLDEPEQDSWGDGPVLRVPLSGSPVTYLDHAALTETEMVLGVGPARYATLDVPVPPGTRIQGRPVVHLRARSDSTSTHFTAILVAAGPAGRRLVARGFLNARYPQGPGTGQDLVPGEERTFRIELIDDDVTLDPTDRLRLVIASSSATWVASDEQRATNTVLPDGSHVEIPVHG
ncbi:MAG TPA: CocE/NonD family hydrolase [Actinomycetota bacterium]|nr:CocE/NonD family hydrolase [Actinomycetota bacterium]